MVAGNVHFWLKVKAKLGKTAALCRPELKIVNIFNTSRRLVVQSQVKVFLIKTFERLFFVIPETSFCVRNYANFICHFMPLLEQYISIISQAGLHVFVALISDTWTSLAVFLNKQTDRQVLELHWFHLFWICSALCCTTKTSV